MRTAKTLGRIWDKSAGVAEEAEWLSAGQVRGEGLSTCLQSRQSRLLTTGPGKTAGSKTLWLSFFPEDLLPAEKGEDHRGGSQPLFSFCVTAGASLWAGFSRERASETGGASSSAVGAGLEPDRTTPSLATSLFLLSPPQPDRFPGCRPLCKAEAGTGSVEAEPASLPRRGGALSSVCREASQRRPLPSQHSPGQRTATFFFPSACQLKTVGRGAPHVT